jgi:hypothetical protein
MARLLTAELLGVVPRPRSVWPGRLAVASEQLRAEYGTPSLGNFRGPVREIVYILLSAKTADAQYRKSSRALFAR